MLTVDFDRFDVGPGHRVLDLGCGEGRHAFEVLRRGASVVAVDRDGTDLRNVDEWFGHLREDGEVPDGAAAAAVRGDALHLPFPDASFDRVVAAEILEHLPDDTTAIAEIARVLAPGGLAAVTVPRWLPERVCWALSDAYHHTDGGHVRVYRRRQLLGRLRAAGLEPLGTGHVHGLHSPYWWLKCATGVDRDTTPVRAYHRLLVWDLERRPLVTRGAERVLDPLIGKSLVVYLRKGGAP